MHVTVTDARAGLAPRVGFVVSRAVGHAVVRNRTKRRLRASAASRLSGIPAGYDVVVRANPEASAATYQQLDTALGRQLTRVLEKAGTR